MNNSRATNQSGSPFIGWSRRSSGPTVNLANEMSEAGYSETETHEIRAEVDHYEKVRREVKLASGDYIDLKMYEPAMRHLLDTYIRAEESEEAFGVR